LGTFTRCICGTSAAVSDAQHVIFNMRIRLSLPSLETTYFPIQIFEDAKPLIKSTCASAMPEM
jgi:hypothetical protein